MKRMVQATVILNDEARMKPWELSVLAQTTHNGYVRRTWDKVERFQDLMTLCAYLITYPEGEVP